MTAAQLLAKLCAVHDIIIIGGGPNVGKTTLALTAKGYKVLHTDHWEDGTIASLSWDDVPEAVAAEAARHPRCIIEGTRAPSVLRHGVKAGGLLWMSKPLEHGPPSDAQMRKARYKALLKMQRQGWLDGVEVEFAP